jgi:hypothetical protein
MPSPPRGVQRVADFTKLVEQPFSSTVNARCWERVLPGDFAEVVAQVRKGSEESLVHLDPESLHALSLSPAGQVARACMLEDFRLLSELNLAPVLNCIHDYPRDQRSGPIATDVFSFHVDSAPTPIDTWLCTYHGPPSEGLCNHEAQRRVDIPATRAALLATYGGADDDGFLEYLSDNAYDLHYAALPAARPYSFGCGHLWRITTQHPGSIALPCIHRAPPTHPADPPRLLLIS